MAPKFVAPMVTAKSFSCPHCGALADQRWFKVHADPITGEGLPHIASQDVLQRANNHKANARGDDAKAMDFFIATLERELTGEIYVAVGDSDYMSHQFHNLHMSKCYSCGAVALWRHDSLLYPSERYEIEPNVDMPDDMKADFEEARRILNESPRGAAALLRLCMQKLCNGLLGKEMDINPAIGELVKQGLRVEIQQALDSVRVVGNQAVHPGVMDLRDDRITAMTLFDLVNIIVEDRISQPKKIQAIYDKLPAGPKAQIAKRDGNVQALPVAGKKP